jgi:hypothetical protein
MRRSPRSARRSCWGRDVDALEAPSRAVVDRLAIDDVEDVAARVLEPRDFHVPGNMQISLQLHARHVAVFEAHAFGFERTYFAFHVIDGPRKKKTEARGPPFLDRDGDRVDQ